MDTTKAAETVKAELRERGIGFTPEGYEHATRRLAELTGAGGLALKTLAGRVNASAKGRK